jgi:hypothetical protein
MSVDPTGADLKRFLAEDPGGPVVMLNLLRFAEDGRPAYEQYAREIQPFLDRVGARVVHVGDLSTALVAPDGFAWDAVLLVEYPTRQAFDGRRPGVPAHHPAADHRAVRGRPAGDHPVAEVTQAVTDQPATSIRKCDSTSAPR